METERSQAKGDWYRAAVLGVEAMAEDRLGQEHLGEALDLGLVVDRGRGHALWGMQSSGALEEGFMHRTVPAVSKCQLDTLGKSNRKPRCPWHWGK